jgi:hypothetical protein
VILGLERTLAPPSAGVELLAIATDEPFEDAFLVGHADHPDREPSVEAHNTMMGATYEGFDPKTFQPLAGSLASLICLVPLTRYMLEPMPLQNRLAQVEPAPGILQSVDACAALDSRLSGSAMQPRGRWFVERPMWSHAPASTARFCIEFSSTDRR